MSVIRTAALVAFSALLLPGLIFVYLALSLVHTNLEEIRSLPNTYLFLVQGFCALWLVNVLVNAAALSGRLEWLARLLIAVGALIFVFDAFRGLWLNSVWQVALVAGAEILVIVAVIAAIRRVDLRTLLSYTALFALIPVGATAVTHVRTVGPKLIWNVVKEIARPQSSEGTSHPRLWVELPSGAEEIGDAVDLDMISGASPEVEIEKSAAFRVRNHGVPGAIAATLPVLLPSSNSPTAVAEIRVRLLAGDLSLGVLVPGTDRWFFRVTALEREATRHTLYVPPPSGMTKTELIFANGPIGQNTFEFEIEAVKAHRWAERIGEGSADPVQIQRVGNVYQILLDAYEQRVFREIIKEDGSLWWNDFTLLRKFPNQPAKNALVASHNPQQHLLRP